MSDFYKLFGKVVFKIHESQQNRNNFSFWYLTSSTQPLSRQLLGALILNLDYFYNEYKTIDVHRGDNFESMISFLTDSEKLKQYKGVCLTNIEQYKGVCLTIDNINIPIKIIYQKIQHIHEANPDLKIICFVQDFNNSDFSGNKLYCN